MSLAGAAVAILLSRRLWAVLALVWMLVVLVLGVALALRMAGLPILGDALETFWERRFVQAAVAVFVAVVVPTLVAWLIVRRYSLWVGLMAVATVVIVGAYLTDSMAAVLVVALQTVTALLVGAGIVRHVLPSKPGTAPPVVRLALAFATGHGVLGLAYLAIGSAGSLSRSSVALVWVLAVSLAIVSLARGPRPRLSLMAWGPASPTGAIVTSIVLGFVAFATLHAFYPETLSDAIRHHLPIAREIWETGSTAELLWWTSHYPIHAQVVSAPAWGIGGAAGVALSHAVAGCFAAVAVAGLARMLAGRLAGVIAAAAFVTMPLVLWEVGHSYVDLYPALFVAAAAVAVVVWQRVGLLRILLLAGFLVGLAFATKVVAASGVAGIGLAVLLVGRDRLSLRARFVAGAVVLAGGLLILPWLWRSFEITGMFPGADLLLSSVAGTERDIARDLGTYGVGRSPLALATLPWSMTFDGGRFGQSGYGAFGVMLLMALPTWLFLPRTRAAAFVLVALVLGLLAWAFTAQYYRYALPQLALAAALTGAGIASLRAWYRARSWGWAAGVVALLVIVALVLAPLMWLPLRRNQVPVGFFTGHLSREEVVADFVRGYEVLRAYPEMVDAEAPAMWVGGASPDIYTDTTLHSDRAEDLGRSAAEVIASLDERGIEHVIWDRRGSTAGDWGARIVSTNFLRANTQPLMVADMTYLFRLNRDGDSGWTRGQELLPPLTAFDPGVGWIPRPGVTMEDGLPSIPAGSNIKAVVDVEPGQAYVVQVRAACAGDRDLTAMALWKNAENRTVGRDRERFVVDTSGRGLAIMASPPDAASVTLHLSPQSGACLLSNASMRSLDGVEVLRAQQGRSVAVPPEG